MGQPGQVPGQVTMPYLHFEGFETHLDGLLKQRSDFRMG
jgi:hypothetical protein